MQLTILLWVATALLSHVLAYSTHSPVALTARSQGKQLGNTYASIDLAKYEAAAATTIEKRTPIDWCIASVERTNICVNAAYYAGALSVGIAAIFKQSSKMHDCKHQTGRNDGVHWEVYITGKNCDTTAQQATISGAIADYLREVDFNICGVQCLRLDHRGSWRGYVTLAPTGQPIDKTYCGDAYAFGKCGTGGKNDQI